jgi:hypothetical protein
MPNLPKPRKDRDMDGPDTAWITPKEHHNYVAFFLTLRCNLNCPYCINLHEKASRGLMGRRDMLTADEWIKAANRLVLRKDLPLTLQGGEPTLHKGFYRITNEVKPEIKMDLMTNMMFDVHEFIRHVPVWRFSRKAPYAPIRVSYHPGQNRIEDLIAKTKIMQDAGFRVGLYGILHPDGKLAAHVRKVEEQCLNQGIDFRVKEFLGCYRHRLFGTFKYADSVMGRKKYHCECRTTEVLVDPSGNLFRCHADLYHARSPIAHVLDTDFNENGIDIFRTCSHYGRCNPCDVKVKTNRFQIFGHTSVEIQNVRTTRSIEPTPPHQDRRQSPIYEQL